MKDFFNKILTLLLPEKCLGCKTTNKGFICPKCLKNIPIVLDNSNGIFAATSYESKVTKNAIWLLKYRRVKKLAEPLANLMFKRIFSNSALPKISPQTTLIIPIPLSQKRLKQRGFNQAELIAEYLSDKLSVKMSKNILEKIKHTEAQVKIQTRQNRLKNLKGTFRVLEPEILREKIIILVDDVATTGATISEASRLLKKAGVKKIIPVVVAKT